MKSVDRSIRYRNFMSELGGDSQPLLLDGPISTELDSRGVTMSSGRSRRSPIDEPEALIQLHVDYINAFHKRINNVHLKDRTYDAKTVYPTAGDTDFKLIFKTLFEIYN